MEKAKTIVFTVGGRTYEAIPVLMKWEDGKATYDRLMRRADQLSAILNVEDGENILDHQEEIPDALSGMRLVCAGWVWNSTDPEGIFGNHTGIFIILPAEDGHWKPVPIDYRYTVDERDRLVRRAKK